MLSWHYLCPRALGWTMSHMISSMRNPGLSAMMGLNMAFRYEMLCMAKRVVNAHCRHEGTRERSCIPWRACTGQFSSAWQGEGECNLTISHAKATCMHPEPPCRRMAEGHFMLRKMHLLWAEMIDARD